MPGLEHTFLTWKFSQQRIFFSAKNHYKKRKNVDIILGLYGEGGSADAVRESAYIYNPETFYDRGFFIIKNMLSPVGRRLCEWITGA